MTDSTHLINLLIILLIIGTGLSFLLPLSIVYLAFVVKRRFGKDIYDKYVEAAEIGVQASEAYILASDGKVKLTSKAKRDLAFDIAYKLLKKDGIMLSTKREKELLYDVIEAIVYKTNNKSTPLKESSPPLKTAAEL